MHVQISCLLPPKRHTNPYVSQVRQTWEDKTMKSKKQASASPRSDRLTLPFLLWEKKQANTGKKCVSLTEIGPSHDVHERRNFVAILWTGRPGHQSAELVLCKAIEGTQRHVREGSQHFWAFPDFHAAVQEHVHHDTFDFHALHFNFSWNEDYFLDVDGMNSWGRVIELQTNQKMKRERNENISCYDFIWLKVEVKGNDQRGLFNKVISCNSKHTQ